MANRATLHRRCSKIKTISINNIITHCLFTILKKMQPDYLTCVVITSNNQKREVLTFIKACSRLFVVHPNRTGTTHHYKFKTQELVAALGCSLLIGCW
jgi:hypothetical protein